MFEDISEHITEVVVLIMGGVILAGMIAQPSTTKTVLQTLASWWSTAIDNMLAGVNTGGGTQQYATAPAPTGPVNSTTNQSSMNYGVSGAVRVA